MKKSKNIVDVLKEENKENSQEMSSMKDENSEKVKLIQKRLKRAKVKFATCLIFLFVGVPTMLGLSFWGTPKIISKGYKPFLDFKKTETYSQAYNYVNETNSLEQLVENGDISEEILDYLNIYKDEDFSIFGSYDVEGIKQYLTMKVIKEQEPETYEKIKKAYIQSRVGGGLYGGLLSGSGIIGALMAALLARNARFDIKDEKEKLKNLLKLLENNEEDNKNLG